MLKIGITGGLGSGKSIVCKVLQQLNVPVFDADYEAKKIVERSNVQHHLKELFGDFIFTNNCIDKKKLAHLIFSDDEALGQMNSYIHPLVAEEFERWTNPYSKMPYVVIEAALLFESKQFASLDIVIVVSSPLELRVQRAMKRDNASKESIMARIHKQMSEEEKCKLANYVIINDEEQMLLSQILELDNKFRTL